MKVIASDGKGSTAESTFNITINEAPKLIYPLDDVFVQQNTSGTFTIPAASFADPEGTTLTYTAQLQNGNDYIDLPSELGNLFYFSIDFEEDPIYTIPKDCEVQSIGWLELNHRPHTSANHMRVKLGKKEFSDFLMLKNHPIHIEPNFNKRKDKKIITEKNEKKVLFHISRITLTPSINNN